MATKLKIPVAEATVRKQFDRCNKDRKIEILMDALELMQQYNGRTRIDCIALAMGYEKCEDKPNSYVKIN